VGATPDRRTRTCRRCAPQWLRDPGASPLRTESVVSPQRVATFFLRALDLPRYVCQLSLFLHLPAVYPSFSLGDGVCVCVCVGGWVCACACMRVRVYIDVNLGPKMYFFCKRAVCVVPFKKFLFTSCLVFQKNSKSVSQMHVTPSLDTAIPCPQLTVQHHQRSFESRPYPSLRCTTHSGPLSRLRATQPGRGGVALAQNLEDNEQLLPCSHS